jgi:hypothetical protein
MKVTLTKALLTNILSVKVTDACVDSKTILNKINGAARLTDIAYCENNKTWRLIGKNDLIIKALIWARNKGYRIIPVEEGRVWVIHMSYPIHIAFNFHMIATTKETVIEAAQWVLENSKGVNYGKYLSSIK